MSWTGKVIISRFTALYFAFVGFFFGLGVCNAVLLYTLVIKLIEAA